MRILWMAGQRLIKAKEVILKVLCVLAVQLLCPEWGAHPVRHDAQAGLNRGNGFLVLRPRELALGEVEIRERIHGRHIGRLREQSLRAAVKVLGERPFTLSEQTLASRRR